MLLIRVVADVFAENCYVLAGDTGIALVVDPGVGTAPAVRDLLADYELDLGAVLLTHGHPDHVWDAAAVAGEAPVYVAEPDARRLENPVDPASPILASLKAAIPEDYVRPARVEVLPSRYFAGGGAEIVPGVGIRAVPAPGHTEGSTVYLVAGTFADEARALAVEGRAGAEVPPLDAPLVLTGDVLFRGAIGRTDLPGGDSTVMQWTLRTLRHSLHPASMLFPGHGPATTMAHELSTNPFLK